MKLKKTMIVLTKGAPEVLLNYTNEVIDGRNGKLTEARKNEILNEIKKLQVKSMRILGFAYRNINAEVEVAVQGKNILKPRLF